MSHDCFLVTRSNRDRIVAEATVVAKATLINNLVARPSGISSISGKNAKRLGCSSLLSGIGGIRGKSNSSSNAQTKYDSIGIGNIRSHLKISGILRSSFRSEAGCKVKHVDKIGGHVSDINAIDDFQAVEKLYPIADISTTLNNSSFITKTSSNNNLFAQIDEGVFIGNYTKNGKISKVISDDRGTYIHPSSIFTKGAFRYKFEVTPPSINPLQSFLFIRAAAPVSDYASNVPPTYKIHNIRFEDPSGNLIIKYKDIVVKGDADYETNYVNFVTYISEPEINNIKSNTWKPSYPIMGEASGYSINLDFSVDCSDDPFSYGFNVGYEDTCKTDYLGSSGQNNYLSFAGSPLSTHGFTLNPNNSIRISAIEVCNSGSEGLTVDNYLNFFSSVSATGQRIQRDITPSLIFSYDDNVQIYPTSQTLWSSSPDSFERVADNAKPSGAKVLVTKIQDSNGYDYITLSSTNPNNDNGRLTLKFENKAPNLVVSYSNGAFSFGQDTNAFETSELNISPESESFFTIDKVELKVLAKKAIGSRNYALDVVGYSEDFLLNRTSKINGFLQNDPSTLSRSDTITTNWLGGRTLTYSGETSGKPLYTYGDESVYWNGYSWVMENINNGIMYESSDDVEHPWLVNAWSPSDGTIIDNPLPQGSGFRIIDDLGIATESFSSKSQYYESSVISNPAGDHYLLSRLPIISSTQFQEYTVPLKIYDDVVRIGKSKDYTISSYFENLYVDIYGLPSGASLSSVRLVVHYKPGNGLALHTVGQQSDIELSRRSLRLKPSARLANDSIDNSSPEYSQLSVINNIPHEFRVPIGIKTNYSRRWRGVSDKVVTGPFDPREFASDYYNPPAEKPFFDGYFSFNNDSGNTILSDSLLNLSTISGYYLGNYNRTENIGLRFDSTSLFSGPTTHKTIDWTRLAGYTTHNLYGKIADAFDNVVRVSGSTGYLKFSPSNTSSGVSIFVRFSPDVSMSGTGYNLWNSGVIFSKFDSGKQLEFALSYEGGKLTAFARDNNSNIIKVQDDKYYYDYQYPLGILLTYNDKESQRLRLYSDHEASGSSWNLLRAESSPFIINSGTSDLTFGYSSGSGIGTHLFISDIGISTANEEGTNILYDQTLNKKLKQCYASDVFDSVRQKFWNVLENASNDRSKLWTYVDDPVDDWKLGDYNVCAFSPSFYKMTQRSGEDYIMHRLKHSGSGYGQLTNIALPSSINASGLAYHTQIENDFIRFSLSDIPPDVSLFSASPRIQKLLPKGYKFQERGFVVESIIEHDTYDDIIWSDDKIGPKLIVSLYTKNQDPINRPSVKNYGLINRAIHYLKPSGCYQKLNSTFNYKDLIDTSEPWANFDLDRNLTEFNHKYYSKDVNDMYLQYDLVYPSGSPFDSTIKIHSCQVKLENAFMQKLDTNSNLNLIASGEKKALSNVNLNTKGNGISFDSHNLFVTANYAPVASSVFNLHCSGAVLSNNRVNIYCHNYGTLASEMPLYVGGRYNKFAEALCPLTTANLRIDQSYFDFFNLFTHNNKPEINNESLILVTLSGPVYVDKFDAQSMRLYINPIRNIETTRTLCYLTIVGLNPISVQNNQINLFTINYPVFNQALGQQTTITWNGTP